MEEIPVDRAPLFGDSADWLTLDNLLARDRQEWIRNLATLVQYGRGERVFSQWEEAHYVHIISTGIVRIFRSGESGKRQIIAFKRPGDLCGLPETGRYINSAETVSVARIYQLPWLLFDKLMMTTPPLHSILVGKMAADVRQAQARITMLGQENILQRVACFLFDMMGVSQFSTLSGRSCICR